MRCGPFLFIGRFPSHVFCSDIPNLIPPRGPCACYGCALSICAGFIISLSCSSAAMASSPPETYTFLIPSFRRSAVFPSMDVSLICSFVGGALVRVFSGSPCDDASFLSTSCCLLLFGFLSPSHLSYLLLVLFSVRVSRYFLLFLFQSLFLLLFLLFVT